MKKTFTALMCLAAVLIMVSCGNNNTSNTDKGAKEIAKELEESIDMTGVTGSMTGSKDLKDLNDDNWAAIFKNISGVEVVPAEGWTLKEAKSPNGVNNLNVVFLVPEDSDMDAVEADVKMDYLEKTLAVAEDGIYPVDMDWNTGTISRGDKYTDAAAFREAFPSAGNWFYDYDGNSIMFSAGRALWTRNGVEVSFVMTSK